MRRQRGAFLDRPASRSLLHAIYCTIYVVIIQGSPNSVLSGGSRRSGGFGAGDGAKSNDGDIGMRES